MSATCAGCGSTVPPNKAPGRPRKWCSERCRKQALYGTPCPRCGAPTNGSNGTRPDQVCKPCQLADLHVATIARAADFRAEVEALWADGLTAREIGKRFGWAAKNPAARISVLRNQRGYDLPHRRTPEQLARITAGSAERMAKARAVYREQRAA